MAGVWAGWGEFLSGTIILASLRHEVAAGHAGSVTGPQALSLRSGAPPLPHPQALSQSLTPVKLTLQGADSAHSLDNQLVGTKSRPLQPAHDQRYPLQGWPAFGRPLTQGARAQVKGPEGWGRAPCLLWTGSSASGPGGLSGTQKVDDGNEQIREPPLEEGRTGSERSSVVGVKALLTLDNSAWNVPCREVRAGDGDQRLLSDLNTWQTCPVPRKALLTPVLFTVLGDVPALHRIPTSAVPSLCPEVTFRIVAPSPSGPVLIAFCCPHKT